MNAFVYYRKIIIAIIFSLLLAYLCSRTTLAQEDYPLLTIIELTPLDIEHVDADDLTELDAYIRKIEGDIYPRPHILVVTENSRSFADVLNRPGNYTGWTGATLSGVNWNFATNQRGRAFEDTPAALSIVTIFERDAVQFGLIAHELSHAVYTTHGDGTTLGDANYWERIANNAYSQSCSNNPHCEAIREIIYESN